MKIHQFQYKKITELSIKSRTKAVENLPPNCYNIVD